MKTETKYRIRIIHNAYADNPFKDWDCNYPLMYDGGRNYGEDYSDGGIDQYLNNFLTDGQLIRHQKKILNLINDDYLNSDIEEAENKEEKIDILNDAIYNFLDESFSNKVKFCEEFNIVHYYGSSTGYSQGDWADVLIVPTPENAKYLGYKLEKITPQDLEGTFKLFGYWAWGDVYGYVLEELRTFKKVYDTGEECNDEEWEEIDSCWGFYGRDPEANGMIDNINYESIGIDKDSMIEMINDADVEYR